jgi:hypothetical protein
MLMASADLGDAIDGVAAFGTGFVGANLADALQHADLNALLLQPGEEAADRVVGPAGRLSDLGDGGACWPVELSGHRLLLGAITWLTGERNYRAPPEQLHEGGPQRSHDVASSRRRDLAPSG